MIQRLGFFRVHHAGAAFACALLALPAAGLAQAQSGAGWFMPDPNKPGARPPATPGTGPRIPPAAAPGAPSLAPVPPDAGGPPIGDPSQQPLPPLQVQLPPMPEVPPVAKGPTPPAAIIGVLSVPDVLRISTAYQQADRELSARRTRLNDEVQKEQNALRDLGQTFANERARLSPEQIRAREKEYADRANESRRKLSERGRIIQEAYQYAMMQIERVIEAVTQQVASAHGVNLVLSRAQVLGAMNEFDLTAEVIEVVNKTLPSVVIPPDGVSPVNYAVPVAGPRANAAPEAAPRKN